MNQDEIIKMTEDYVKKELEKESSGHDWWHTDRVRNMAKSIAKKEGGNLFIIELASLLHDIGDWKLVVGDESVGPNMAKGWLKKLKVKNNIIDEVSDIIANVSFKGANYKNKMKTIEGKIVQDADRLDAIGAIGIARVFAFRGHHGGQMHDPDIKPKVNKTVEEYKRMDNTAINHFYEKLLLLKDRMNTETAKKIAEERHEFMEEFLKEFFKEWKVK